MRLYIALWFIGWTFLFVLATVVMDRLYESLYFNRLPKEKQERIMEKLKEWQEPKTVKFENWKGGAVNLKNQKMLRFTNNHASQPEKHSEFKTSEKR